jgi:transposase
MYLKNLPRSEVVVLETAFKTAKNPREKLKFQALWLLTQGYPRVTVAQIVARSRMTLGNWVTAFNRYGLDGLKNKPSPKNHHLLTDAQKDQVQHLITSKTPVDLGYPGSFWTTHTLKLLVKDKFTAVYRSPESCRRLLIRSGFSYHKPEKQNDRKQSHLVKRFEDTLKKDSLGISQTMVWYW